jgi:hypothetical protein
MNEESPRWNIPSIPPHDDFAVEQLNANLQLISEILSSLERRIAALEVQQDGSSD